MLSGLAGGTGVLDATTDEGISLGIGGGAALMPVVGGAMQLWHALKRPFVPSVCGATHRPSLVCMSRPQ